MMSFEGNYIRRKPDSENKNNYIYVIDPDLDSPPGGFNIISNFYVVNLDIALKNLVIKILPLCVNHDRIEVFINIHS